MLSPVVLSYFLWFLSWSAEVSGAVLAPTVLREWNNFKAEHGKIYSSPEEDAFRMQVWKQNIDHIAEHNLRYYQANLTFRLAMNAYGDLLLREFLATHSGTSRKKSGFIITTTRAVNKILLSGHQNSSVKLPASVDWRTKGAVTPVKKQGTCGSCWAFATTGSLEGQMFLKTGKLVSLSEQNLLDCVDTEAVNGCHGGVMDDAFIYIRNNGGIDTEKSYPYEEKEVLQNFLHFPTVRKLQKGRCRYNPTHAVAMDVGFHDIPDGDEDALKVAVAQVGPVAAGIDATHKNFQFYSDGVYREENCTEDNLNHGVLIVGYGTTHDGEDYWLIKNSWGSEWGQEGYFRLARNANNMCGVTAEASYPLVKAKV